jgi:isopentenyldiphosphate isomerase
MKRLYQVVYNISMDIQEEFLEVINENGDTINTLPRSVVHGDPSLMHKVVHVLIFNQNGELLLQKRSMNKDVAPGKWDTSVGGHVNAGETIIEALGREMEEELGIAECKPEFLYTYIHSNQYESELVYTHSCVHSGQIRFNKDEIDEIRLWSIDEIRQNLGKGIFSDNFKHEFKTYMKFMDIN